MKLVRFLGKIVEQYFLVGGGYKKRKTTSHEAAS